ncbi:MAG: tetratricopeptide repeat protein [bacterium]
MPEDKSALIKTAYSYYQKGDWDRAIEEYHKLAELDAKDLNVHNMLADIYAKKGDVKEAMRQYDLVAQGFDQKNQVDKVLQVYKRMIKLTPKDEGLAVAVKSLVGRYMDRAAQAEESDPDKTAEIYRAILKAEPARVDVNIQLAKLLMKRGQKFDAVELLMNLAALLDPTAQAETLADLLQTVTAWDPLNIEAREKLTEFLLESHQKDAAVSSLQALVEIYISKKDLVNAEKTAQRAIQLGDVETYYHLGVIFFNQQKFEEGRAAFEKFLSKQDTHVGALKYLAMVYTRLGHIPKAVAVYLKILNVYFSENLLEEARDIQRIILEMDPNNEDVKTYAEGLNPPSLDTIPEEIPEPPAPEVDADAEKNEYLAQAQAYSEKGLYEQAIDVYLDMLKRWPEWLEIRTKLQQVYALMARANEPVEKGPTPEELKAELTRELKEQMRHELEEQTRKLTEEQNRIAQERQFEADMKREMEQIRLKQDLESKLLEQVQRSKEVELRERIAKEFEEKQKQLIEDRDRLEKDRQESMHKMKDELEQTKLSYERTIREQAEKQAKDKFQLDAIERDRQEKEALRQVHVQAALQKQELERTQFEEQKKVQENVRAKVDQEILQGMERLRFEKEKEKKTQAEKPAPVTPKPSAPSPASAKVSHGMPGSENLEDPFIRQTLADIYAKQGLFVEALKIYERILNDDPDNEDVKEKLRNILKLKGM